MSIQGKLYLCPPYEQETVKFITDSFTRLLGRDVVLSLHEDESIIGGFRATIDGKLYDASVLTKTNRALECLTQKD